MEFTPFYIIIGVWICISLVVFFVLLKIPAPYGRHTRPGWGPSLSARVGWFVMELPSVLIFFLLFLTGSAEKSLVSFLFLILWELHYINRAFIFPFRIRGDRKQMALTIMLMALFFNVMNGSINGFYLFTLAGRYDLEWLMDVRFISGVLLFFIGFVVNQVSDAILRNLRGRNNSIQNVQDRYRIPKGFLFEMVSCPNYFGEIIEWLGWALLTWSVSGLAFFIWTAANLLPRALSHHRWYGEQFPEYPKIRRAVLPFLL
jgi:protein-S-isoprenylcysteine O-methyltransferase Ste14